MNKKPRMGRRTLTFLCCVLAVPTCVKLFHPFMRSNSLQTSLLAGALLGAAYLLVRPILKLLTLPIGCLTLGLFSFFIDATLIMALPYVFPGFVVESYLWALLAALLVDGVCLITGGIH